MSGVPVRVAMPEGANPSKVAATRALGAEVVIHGSDFDEAREWITAEAQNNGARAIGPTDPKLIAGVGTYTLEIMDALPDVEVIFVPVGAGSGASSVSLVAKTINPQVQVIAVQAKDAPAIHDSWQARRALNGEMHTAAEGLATRVAFQNTLDMMLDPKTGIDDFVLVSDEQMEDAMLLLLEHTHNLAELAGAATLAAALQLKPRLAGKKVALVLSGGNIATDQLRTIVAKSARVEA